MVELLFYSAGGPVSFLTMGAVCTKLAAILKTVLRSLNKILYLPPDE